jgi:hypothetical protein
MIIDMGGRGSFIDASIRTEAFMPVQHEPPRALSTMGQAVWASAAQQYHDVSRAVSSIIEVRQFLRNQGHARDDVNVYYVGSFDSVLDAGTQMQHYIMAHPQMQLAYQRGLDLYPNYVMPAESHVYYGRALDGIVQFRDDGTEYFTSHVDFGYDDLHLPSLMDKHNLNATYRYMRENIDVELSNLLLDCFEEE